MAAGEVQLCRGSGTFQTLRKLCDVFMATRFEHHSRLRAIERRWLVSVLSPGFTSSTEPFENQFHALYKMPVDAEVITKTRIILSIDCKRYTLLVIHTFFVKSSRIHFQHCYIFNDPSI